MYGEGGNDKVYGGDGEDYLDGGPGKDRFRAGSGNDTVNSRDGCKEKVDCGSGFDRATVDFSDIVVGCELVSRA